MLSLCRITRYFTTNFAGIWYLCIDN